MKNAIKRQPFVNKWITFTEHRRFRVFIFVLGVVFALVAFEEVADDVFQDPTVGDYEARDFDQAIGSYVSGLRSEAVTKVMIELTALGSVSVILTLFVIFVAVLASFRDVRGIVFISAVLLGAGLWPPFLKSLFARTRPDQIGWLVNVSELSFPSGHAFGAAAAYVGFAYYASLYARSWRQETFFYVLAGLLAALVGTSRIYLGVHFPTDVLAGISGGIAWGLFSCAVYEFWFRRAKNKPS